MPAVARKNGEDSVNTPDGGPNCGPATFATDKGSDNVFANSIGVVRAGDKMKSHGDSDNECEPHAPALSTFSSTVFINGCGCGRKGDEYSLNHIISTGSPNVFAGSAD